MNPTMRDSAVAISIGNRWFYGFGSKGQVKTAWCLAGAKLFGRWGNEEIDKVEKRLARKGRAVVRHVVSIDLLEELSQLSEKPEVRHTNIP